MTYPHIANIFLGGNTNLCLTFRLKSSSCLWGGLVGRLTQKALRPLTGRLVHLFSFWSMSGLKCDAVIRWLGGCQLGCVFVWWTDHDFWLLVGYGALTNSGLFINGASGCAGMFFCLSFFLQYWSIFCLNCSCPKTHWPLSGRCSGVQSRCFM